MKGKEMIDPHVHCRDGKQAYKETIAHVFKIAREQGVEKVFDMPNTDPPIISGTDVQERLRLVPPAERKNYFLYLGLTSNKNQLKEAVDVFRRCKAVVGFKLYAGESVGDLAIVNEEQQRKIYTILSALEYTGVIAVHCEKESELKPELWNPDDPISHCLARPKQAEINSIQDQIRFVKKSGFKGTLHIVHVSCPESVELIDAARKEVKITCGVTPHHILFSDLTPLSREDALICKMNPPLRKNSDAKRLLEQLKAGKIDWIETDHAPHAIGEKLFPPYLSGYPSLYLYKYFVTEFLPKIGINQPQIKRLTSENVCKTFGLEA